MADVSKVGDADVKDETIIEVTDHGILNRLVGNIPRKETQQQQVETTVVTPKVDDVDAPVVLKNGQSVVDTLLPKRETKDGSTLNGKVDVEAPVVVPPTDVETPDDESVVTTVDEDTVIGGLMAKFGTVEGEFEDTAEGLEQYIEKLTPKIIEEGEKQGVQKLVKELPVVGDLIQHLMAGYRIDSFQKKYEVVDYKKVELKEDDLVAQEAYYRRALVAKGNAEDDINDLVEGAKDSGKLFEKSKKSLEVLDGIQSAQIEQMKAQEKLANDAAVKAEQDTLKQIDTILKAGNLAGVPLNTTEIKALRDFGTVVDKQGLTERDRKWNDLTLEQMLLLDKIVMEDFKGLGVKINSQNKTKSLKDLKAKNDSTKVVDMTSSTSDGKEGFKNNTKSLFGNNTN